MLPWEIVARAAGPDGAEWVLARRGDEWVVRVAGRALMSSRQHGSEEALAAVALGRLPKGWRDPPGRRKGDRGGPTVLVGGLGLGFTLRAALDRLPEDARVVVAELVPALVEWNRAHVAHLAGRPLDDRRTRLQQGDVLSRIAEAKGAFDAILLDVDNGPSAVALGSNHRLYGSKGVRACRDALRAGGVLAVWSAGPDERYLERLQKAGLETTLETVPAREGTSKGARHVVFLAVKTGDEARPGSGPRPGAGSRPESGSGTRSPSGSRPGSRPGSRRS